MSIQEYKRKRDFRSTAEPAGDDNSPRAPGLIFVVQKHAARRLHYDFRLEMDGVLKSWAVPKGPSLDPAVKSLAVQVEDHPLDYRNFEGTIPKGQYGGGTVMVWDHGTWDPSGDADKGLARGKMTFRLVGEKLSGTWSLVQMKGSAGEDGKNWLLIKKDDGAARDTSDFDVVTERPESVLSGRAMEAIASNADRVSSNAGKKHPPPRQRRPAKKGTSTSRRLRAEVAELPNARRAQQPCELRVQLATLATTVPTGDRWLHELKLDGYRIVTVIENGKARLFTRNGNDWTDRFSSIAHAAERLPLESAILDGEVVALDDTGITDFQRLQNSVKRGRQDALVYYVFDLPYVAGYDLTQTPLVERKRWLASLLLTETPNNDGTLRYSDHICGQGHQVIEHACRFAMEGVVSKQADSPYQGRRTKTWVKIKCLKRQEFVIGGYTKPSGSRIAFGALLLGYYDNDRLVYCGRVGTGFTEDSLQQIKSELAPRRTDSPAFDNPPTGSQRRGVTWVRPELVAEVEFAQWTDDEQLRHSVFHGLREDKPPQQIVREEPMLKTPSKHSQNSEPKRTRSKSTSSRRESGDKDKVAGVRLTNPDRVLFPQQGITKLALAEFYEAIADWVLPHVVGRPLSLVRCPQGQEGDCFFQKHLTESMPDRLRGVQIDDEKKPSTYVVIDDLPGLISLVQMSVLELHPWPAREDRLDRPDQLVFDLDPGEGTNWWAVVTAAGHVRDLLRELDLQSFVRTSGGKGLHVVVPLVRRTEWNELKQFAKAVAERLSAEHSDRYIATSSKARRQGKVFIDYLRNQRGATAVACYSTRARPNASVATPLRWDELDERLKPDKYTVLNLRNRLSSLDASPWPDFHELRQSITKSMLSRLLKS
ncbi:MAG TPA: DNA ligase D [Pirellulaceae bacterium]|nr:DNA ligase D [Pirellulaceae bacterium]